MNDPIADNQTENTITVLLTGNATNQVRDRATAALLSGLQKLGTTVAEMKANLWKPDDLTRFFEKEHERKCKECPARKHAEEVKTDGKQIPKWVVYVLVSLVSALCGALGVKIPTF